MERCQAVLETQLERSQTERLVSPWTKTNFTNARFILDQWLRTPTISVEIKNKAFWSFSDSLTSLLHLNKSPPSQSWPCVTSRVGTQAVLQMNDADERWTRASYQVHVLRRAYSMPSTVPPSYVRRTDTYWFCEAEEALGLSSYHVGWTCRGKTPKSSSWKSISWFTWKNGSCLALNCQELEKKFNSALEKWGKWRGWVVSSWQF